MKRQLLFILLALTTALTAHGQEAAADSTSLPTDLKCYLLVCDPDNTFYASYGHCALRMTCPSEGFDVTFSYFLDDFLANRIKMFQGKGRGAYLGFQTENFLKEYKMNDRGVRAYEVNLTLEQIRALWQLLDEEVKRGAHRKYNYLHTNCSSMCFYALERVLREEQIVCNSYDPGVTGTYREFVGRISAKRPWEGFFWTTILGADGDSYGQIEEKMAPMLIEKSLGDMQITDPQGQARPFVVGTPEVLLPQGLIVSRPAFTPAVLFLLLLLIAVAFTLWQLVKPKSPTAHLAGQCFDTLLLAAQTVAGIVILYLSCFSQMDGAANNWNLLVLNPLPFLLWLLCRHKKWYANTFRLYVLVLIAYMLLAVATPQVDTLHILMVSPLLVRALYHGRRHSRP